MQIQVLKGHFCKIVLLEAGQEIEGVGRMMQEVNVLKRVLESLRKGDVV